VIKVTVIEIINEIIKKRDSLKSSDLFSTYNVQRRITLFINLYTLFCTLPSGNQYYFLLVRIPFGLG
jgi:hypothetical protein